MGVRSIVQPGPCHGHVLYQHLRERGPSHLHEARPHVSRPLATHTVRGRQARGEFKTIEKTETKTQTQRSVKETTICVTHPTYSSCLRPIPSRRPSLQRFVSATTRTSPLRAVKMRRHLQLRFSSQNRNSTKKSVRRPWACWKSRHYDSQAVISLLRA